MGRTDSSSPRTRWRPARTAQCWMRSGTSLGTPAGRCGSRPGDQARHHRPSRRSRRSGGKDGAMSPAQAAFDFTGQVVCVSGGATGIGAASAVAFAAADVSLAEWYRVIGVNLTGVFLVCRAGLRHMYRQGSGVLVITSSPHALATVPDAAAYAASKGGVHALTRALALEAAPRGIRVNALVPGTIDTPMVRREVQVAADPGAQLARLAASHPLGRLGRPEELASVALFLASDAASFITGTTVHADGGLMAALPSGPALPYNTPAGDL